MCTILSPPGLYFDPYTCSIFYVLEHFVVTIYTCDHTQRYLHLPFGTLIMMYHIDSFADARLGSTIINSYIY